MFNKYNLPRIIQGGMGLGISNWRLAHIVSRLGEQGTISGMALELFLTRDLQRGDPGGHVRRAMRQFPCPEIAERIIKEYYVEGGVTSGSDFKPVDPYRLRMTDELAILLVMANFTYMRLAIEGPEPNGIEVPISVNFLTEVEMPLLPSIYGAMLGGASCITMGAGLPVQIPKMMINYATGESASYMIGVIGQAEDYKMVFDPKKYFGSSMPLPTMPWFYPIISTDLARMAIERKQPEGIITGFVVEEPTAGGHNASPRNKEYDKEGVRIMNYGNRDYVDYLKLADYLVKTNRWFYAAGSYSTYSRIQAIMAMGAQGVQVGTLFALCQDSGMGDEYREEFLKKSREDLPTFIETDPLASPTGFPFEVVDISGTVSDPAVYRDRKRNCSIQALVKPYVTPSGGIGYRCPSEPIELYEAKGGDVKDTHRRVCLCNNLMATAKYGNPREPAVVTGGKDVSAVAGMREGYTAQDVIQHLRACMSL